MCRGFQEEASQVGNISEVIKGFAGDKADVQGEGSCSRLMEIPKLTKYKKPQRPLGRNATTQPPLQARHSSLWWSQAWKRAVIRVRGTAATHVSVIASVTFVLQERTTLAPLLYSHAERGECQGILMSCHLFWGMKPVSEKHRLNCWMPAVCLGFTAYSKHCFPAKNKIKSSYIYRLIQII